MAPEAERSSLASRALLLGALLVAAVLPLGLVVRAAHVNGFESFPLDDAWIHLQFARNLARHHTLAYSPGEPPVAGSTSPLFTLLLAGGFAVTDDEKTLAYVLGLAAQLGFLAAFAALARRRLGDGLAALAVLVVGLDADIALLAASGMETPLFLALLVLALDAHARGRRRWAGLLAGVATWARPEGLLLLAVLALDLLLPRAAVAAERLRAVRELVLGAAGPVLGYFAWNVAVGGSVFPDTFAAKTAYYALNSRADFVTGDVAAAFGHGGLSLLLPLGLAAIALEAWRLLRGRAGPQRAELGWAVAVPIAYLVALPFAHRFHRYLVPALPALVLVALALPRRLESALRSEWRPRLATAVAVLAVAAVALQAAALPGADRAYRGYCRVHHLLQEETGRWLASHTPPDAVIATHDVGAIAFYSGRRIVDMVGVVKPEVVAHLNRPGYFAYLRGLFAREGVTHLVVLRSWFELDNSPPLFVAAPGPEVLEVYRWDPEHLHLVPPDAARLRQLGFEALRRGDPAAAREPLEQSLAIDAGAGRTWMLYGLCLEGLGRLDEAADAYRRCLAVFPELAAARQRLTALTGPTPG